MPGETLLTETGASPAVARLAARRRVQTYSDRIRAVLRIDPCANRGMCLHDDDTRLWLVLDDRRVLAFRLHGVGPRSRVESLAARLVAAVAADPGGHVVEVPLPSGRHARLLYAAPVVPRDRAGALAAAPSAVWGIYRDALDTEVLRQLDGLREYPDGPGFYASIRNYNRLAALPPERRERRLQALARFPALVVPLLLTRHQTPNLHDGQRHAWRHRAPAVEEAIDRGRDLTGALAEHYAISRGMVRADLNARWWPMAYEARRHTLAVLDLLPPERRPRSAEALLRHAGAWSAYLALTGIDSDQPRRPIDPTVHAGAFRDGFEQTFARIALNAPGPGLAITDTRDFLAAAAHRSDELVRGAQAVAVEDLAEAWLTCHGLARLVEDSVAWHRTADRRPRADPVLVAIDTVPAVLGRLERDFASATEITTLAALIAEGDSMRHCVASYWYAVVAGDRIFHLEIAQDGERPERATAHCTLGTRGANPKYRLAQLRGPGNAEVSSAMATFARTLEGELNAWSRQSERREALAFRNRMRDRHRLEPADDRVEAAPLGSALERRLARALAWLGVLPMPTDRLLLAPIAGWDHHDGRRHLDALAPGVPLALVREPDNPNDPSAIRIDWQGNALGYVPRRAARTLAERLDAGERLEARIFRIERRMPGRTRVLFEMVGASAPPAPSDPSGDPSRPY